MIAAQTFDTTFVGFEEGGYVEPLRNAGCFFSTLRTCLRNSPDERLLSRRLMFVFWLQVWISC